MRWDNTPTKTSTFSLRSVTPILSFGIRFLIRKMIAKSLRLERQWLNFTGKANCCKKCLIHAIHLWWISMLLLSSQTAYSAEISKTQAVKIIIAEASILDLRGMQGVAEVIRRRPKSAFSSTKRPDFEEFVASHPKKIWDRAEKAWKLSEHSNITNGATLYENIKDFGFPKTWDKSKVVKVAKIGKHTFYRESHKTKKAKKARKK